jgi:hypothetical protein
MVGLVRDECDVDVIFPLTSPMILLSRPDRTIGRGCTDDLGTVHADTVVVIGWTRRIIVVAVARQK